MFLILYDIAFSFFLIYNFCIMRKNPKKEINTISNIENSKDIDNEEDNEDYSDMIDDEFIKIVSDFSIALDKKNNGF